MDLGVGSFVFSSGLVSVGGGARLHPVLGRHTVPPPACTSPLRCAAARQVTGAGWGCGGGAGRRPPPRCRSSASGWAAFSV